MEEIIKAFGIDGRLITIQIVNFFVLLGALSYLLYTPLMKMLDERKKLIEKGVMDARNAALSLQNADKEKKGILSEAVSEASDIVKRGEESAKREAATIVTSAHEQSARIVTDGEKKATALADAIRKETEAEVAKAALLAAEKILKERA